MICYISGGHNYKRIAETARSIQVVTTLKKSIDKKCKKEYKNKPIKINNIT